VREVGVAPGTDDGYVVATEAQLIHARKREADLVDRYRRHLGRTPRQFVAQAIRPLGNAGEIRTDAFDKKARLLIEAKSAADRNAIRMAIGQLKDYVRFIQPRPEVAVLLPERPVKDLQDLLSAEEIHAIWADRAHGFVDTASGRFTQPRRRR
jgi:hypothetical protein